MRTNSKVVRVKRSPSRLPCRLAITCARATSVKPRQTAAPTSHTSSVPTKTLEKSTVSDVRFPATLERVRAHPASLSWNAGCSPGLLGNRGLVAHSAVREPRARRPEPELSWWRGAGPCPPAVGAGSSPWPPLVQRWMAPIVLGLAGLPSS